MVAIMAAAAAGAGNAVVTLINRRMQRNVDDQKHGSDLALERSNAESDRIL
jgi:hypothetical protein